MSSPPDSDHLPYAWLKERLDSIEKRMTEHNGAMRHEMITGFAELRRVFSDHEDDDRIVEHRVTVIETERDFEKRTASQHGAIAGSVSAGLVLGLVEGVKRMFGHG